jgi:hypothetical protein
LKGAVLVGAYISMGGSLMSTAKWLILLFAAGACGCNPSPCSPEDAQHCPVSAREIKTTMAALHRIWGPDQEVLCSGPICCDLNADGHVEILVLLYSTASRDSKEVATLALADVREGIYADGFAVLEVIEGRTWPVFYYWVHWGLVLQVKELDGHVGLVSEGGRDHRQAFWGWVPDDEFPPPYWTAKERYLDNGTSKYGPWRYHCMQSSAAQGK